MPTSNVPKPTTLSLVTPNPPTVKGDDKKTQDEPLPIKKEKDAPDSVEEHQTDIYSKMLINAHKELTGKTISESAAEGWSKRMEKMRKALGPDSSPDENLKEKVVDTSAVKQEEVEDDELENDNHPGP